MKKLTEKDIGKLIIKHTGNNQGLYRLIAYDSRPSLFIEGEKKCRECGHGKRVLACQESIVAQGLISLEEVLKLIDEALINE